MNVELTQEQLRLLVEALEIADAWHESSKRFSKLRRYFAELLKTL